MTFFIYILGVFTLPFLYLIARVTGLLHIDFIDETKPTPRKKYLLKPGMYAGMYVDNEGLIEMYNLDPDECLSPVTWPPRGIRTTDYIVVEPGKVIAP